jgi:diguanylate cyclase (GGDEF)-like protein
MPARGLQGLNVHRASALRVCPPEMTLNHKTLTTLRRVDPSDQDLEDLLSSALLASDKQLNDVVKQVDEIARSLKSGEIDTEALRVAVHPAVWCAVRHLILERELRYLALTDDLTCLYNRRGFFAAATQQLRMARRNAKNMLLIFCDLDRLKEINDKYGHREGDLALVRTADALEDAFRDSDILARLGGDEFAVLAPDASVQDQSMLLDRLEKCVKKANAAESRYKLAVSVGVARFDPKRAVTLGVLMAQADDAMYEQKRRKARLVAQ